MWFQCLVWIVGTKEVSLAHEEALLVVIGIYKPAGNAIGVVADNLAVRGAEDIHAMYLHLNLLIICFKNFYIQLTLCDCPQQKGHMAMIR